MALDLQKALRAGLDASRQNAAPARSKKNRLSSGRAFLLGAGLATAGRLLVRSRGHDIFEGIREKLESLSVDDEIEQPVEGVADDVEQSVEGVADDVEEHDQEPPADQLDDEEDGGRPAGDLDEPRAEEEEDEQDEELGDQPFQPSPVRVAKGGKAPH